MSGSIDAPEGRLLWSVHFFCQGSGEGSVWVSGLLVYRRCGAVVGAADIRRVLLALPEKALPGRVALEMTGFLLVSGKTQFGTQGIGIGAGGLLCQRCLA